MKLFILLLTCLVWSGPAIAYIDPVNGAMLLQLLLSGIAGAVIVFRRVIGGFISRLRALWTNDSHE